MGHGLGKNPLFRLCLVERTHFTERLLSDKFSCCEIQLKPVDNRRLLALCGRLDEHLRQIETRLGVEISNRGNIFQIVGEKAAVHITYNLLHTLYALTQQEEALTPASLHLALQESHHQLSHQKNHPSLSSLAIKTPKLTIKPRTENQKAYLHQIQKHDVTFGIGPAGTGKTYLAVACAVAALEAEKVRRLILVRPAVEAGERLGFLPGDLSQKIDPYLRPLYDALYDMLGFERVAKLMERSVIELLPLAYMRGRTLNEAFILLDEAQNTTIEQMKMFLTRLGFGSTAVVTGDVTQVDLPNGTPSGLRQVMQVLHSVPDIAFHHFDASDVVRHPIVQKIVQAYDHYENHSHKPP